MQSSVLDVPLQCRGAVIGNSERYGEQGQDSQKQGAVQKEGRTSGIPRLRQWIPGVGCDEVCGTIAGGKAVEQGHFFTTLHTISMIW